MPLLTIRTSNEISTGDRGRIMQEISRQLATLLNKPERYVMVALETGQAMLFAGSDQPTAYLELKSIGLPGDQTKALAHSLCDLIHEQLAVPNDRIYIEFSDLERHMFGWNGNTFER